MPLITLDLSDELLAQLQAMVDDKDSEPVFETVEEAVIDILEYHLLEPEEMEEVDAPSEAELEAGEDATPEPKDDA